ncbi:MAG: transcription termination factor Rho [Acidimicrobiia bacterium]|nr:transcription termination factor Rho [Acidimicrobiia bacterium]
MAEQQLERSMLDGKDREQLHAIAGAMGIKGVTRLRKADLVDAILGAATGGANGGANGDANGDAAAKPAKATKATKAKTGKRTATTESSAETAADAPAAAPARKAIRSKRASELSGDDGDLAAIAEEENSLGGGDDEPEVAPRPMRRNAPSGGATSTSDTKTEVKTDARSDAKSESKSERSTSRAGGSNDNASARAPRVDPDDERASFGEGNRSGRRRRRRGRDRSGSGGGGSGGGGGDRGNERGNERGGADRDRGADAETREFSGEPIDVQGLLDLRDEGYGFMRTTGYLPGRADVYVSASQVRRFALRKGDFIKGATRPPASNEKYPALLRVDEINAMEIESAKNRPRFEDLTPLFPDERLSLEMLDDPTLLTGRIVDLLSPIGKGQRGLIVSPPKVGKTTIMKQIVAAIERNNPEVHLMVLLVDERPEEVTDMRRHVQRGEVIASTFDRPSDEHTLVAELAIERAKRLVELGKDVVILLDGITRLARAYNLAAPASGRIMSGGIDAGALYPPKRFFGAARNVEEGGSLTIIATALVDTNSKMDEHIFEEFKGTGNMELKLDRKLAERRLFPAIDVNASSTRHEELLMDRDELNQVWKLRRVLNALAQEGSSAPGLELLIDKLKTTKSNDEFLAEIAKAPTPGG